LTHAAGRVREPRGFPICRIVGPWRKAKGSLKRLVN